MSQRLINDERTTKMNAKQFKEMNAKLINYVKEINKYYQLISENNCIYILNNIFSSNIDNFILKNECLEVNLYEIADYEIQNEGSLVYAHLFEEVLNDFISVILDYDIDNLEEYKSFLNCIDLNDFDFYNLSLEELEQLNFHDYLTDEIKANFEREELSELIKESNTTNTKKSKVI